MSLRANGAGLVRGAVSSITLAVVLVSALASCDTKVLNPGPMLDSNVDDAGAHPALVNGGARSTALALQLFGMTGGVIAREIVGSGNITDHGITPLQDAGTLRPGDATEADDHWNYGNQARFGTEEAVRRIRAALGPAFATSAVATQALLWAGFANRLLGENVCQATFDGGPAQPRTVYFQRAVTNFTEAITNARSIKNASIENAALVGRAAANAWLGKWTDVVADAQLVPKTFKFQAPYFATTTVNLGEHNRIFFASAGTPWRNHTVYGMFYQNYYLQSKDPRVAWKNTGLNGNRGFPPPPWYVQLKYTGRDSPVNLATGREARYLMAEARLRSNDIAGAVQLINELRAEATMPAENPATAPDAWSLLRRERAVEFWLEARRLGDIWRWETEKAPGVNPDEALLAGRARCFPFSSQETDANPNF